MDAKMLEARVQPKYCFATQFDQYRDVSVVCGLYPPKRCRCKNKGTVNRIYAVISASNKQIVSA
jgi:hypothetical protein